MPFAKPSKGLKIILVVVYLVGMMMLYKATYPEKDTFFGYYERNLAAAHKVSLSPLNKDILSNVKDSTLFIGGLAHNNGNVLAKTLEVITTIGEQFKEYHIAIYENDSTDDTVEIIEEWMNNNANKANIHFITEKTTEKPAIQHGSINIGRYMRMGAMRNRLLDTLKSISTPIDYVSFVDLDVWDISLDGFFDNFRSKILAQWQAVGANGARVDGRYYDAIGFESDQFTNTNNPTQLAEARTLLFPPQTPLYPVRSMFGGMVIIQKYCIKQCNYNVSEEICEHRAFMRCIRTVNKCDKVFINPDFQVTYHVKSDMYGK